MKLKLIIVSLVLIINVGFTFTVILSSFYQSENENTSKFSTITSFFSGEIRNSETEFTKIIQLLKQDKDIETKTIMAISQAYSFNTNSNFIFTWFNEGEKTDTVEDFITRKNWSEFELWYSDFMSIHPHKSISHQMPDYLIFSYVDTVIDPGTTWYVSDQNFYIHSLLINPEIPANFQVIYRSDDTNIIVYKINYDR